MKRLLAAACLIALSACNNKQAQTTESSNAPDGDTTTMRIQIPKQGCYMHVAGRDTIRLKVETFPNVVTGTLQYNFYEKDKSSGDLEGVLHGDTLVADYSFMSEGVRSMRKVFFLIKDSMAIEGYGETTIDFSKGTRLTKVSCVEDIIVPMDQPLTGGSEILYQYKWKLVKLEGKAIEGLAEQRIPELAMSPGKLNSVTGNTGCNRLSGSFDLPEPGKIKFSPLITTRMACVDANIESQFLAAMEKADGWETGQKVLKLKAGKKVVLEFSGK